MRYTILIHGDDPNRNMIVDTKTGLVFEEDKDGSCHAHSPGGDSVVLASPFEVVFNRIVESGDYL